MRRISTTARVLAVGGALFYGAGLGFLAQAQTPAQPPAAPPPAAAPAPAGAPAATAQPSPARIAIENRKAVYTLVGNNFRLIGAVLKGATPYDAAAVQKAIARVVFLSALVDEAFPDVSNVGEPETKAKPAIWTNRADFDKKLREFQTHLVALQIVNDSDKNASEAFKTAATAVGQDCKGCHDDFRVK
jgi:cytochrome c556